MNIETFGSICSGVGMQEMAILKVWPNVKLKYFSEIDKYAIKSFEAIHGQVKNLGDFTKELYPDHVDFLFGSTPCQDFSLAGKQKGFEGFRGSLTGEFIDFIKRMDKKPKVVGFENVTGLLQEQFKEGYAMFKNEFKQLGYKVNEFILNAKDYGIPQNRDRVFLLCTQENLVIKNPKKKKLKLVLKDLLEKNVDEKFYIPKEKTEKLLKELKGEKFNPKEYHSCYDMSSREFRKQGFAEISSTLCSRDYKSQKCVVIPNIHELIQVGLLETKGNEQTRRAYDAKGISPTLDTMQGGNRQPKILENYSIRKLTPLECWRLMGISDENFYKAQEVNSNSQLYKQAGNGIVVDVLEALFLELKNSYIETQSFEVVGNNIQYCLF